MIFYLVMCLPVKMFELIILLFYSPFFFLCLIIFVAVLPEPACLVCLIRLPYINPPLQMPGLE
jgi:O-antigen ligase